MIDEISKCLAVGVIARGKADFRREANWEIDIQARIDANSAFPGFLLSILRIPKANTMFRMDPDLSRPVVIPIASLLDCCPWLFSTVSAGVILRTPHCNQEFVGELSVKLAAQLRIEFSINRNFKSVGAAQS